MLYFLLGIVFVLIGLPLLDSLSSLISSVFNALISVFNLCASSVNARILRLQRDIGYDEGHISTNAIGFQSYSPEEYYDEDEYDE